MTLDNRLREIPFKLCAYVFLAALAVRLLYLSQYASSPFFAAPELDALYHDLLARAIVAGKEQPEPFFRAPGYYYFLAGIYKVFGHGYWAPRLLQAVIGSGSCVLLLLLGSRLFRPVVGLGAAVAMALYGPLVFFDGELHTPVLEVFLDLAFLLLALRAWETPSLRLWAAAGLVLGLSAIVRPNALTVLPLLLGAALWKSSVPAPRRAGWAAAALAAALLFPGLVTLRNGVVAGDPVFIASQGGINMWLGNRPESDGFTPSTPKRYRFNTEYEDSVALYGQRAAEEALGRTLKASESQSYWMGRSLEWWRDDPKSAAALYWKKWVLTWGRQEVRNTQAFDFMRQEYAPILWICAVGFWIAGPLGLLGMFLAWKRVPSSRFLALFALLYAASFLPFFVADRYRLPVVPVLLLFGAFAAVWLWEKLQARETAKLVRLAPALACLALFVNVEWYRIVTPATWSADYWSAGNRYRKLGKLPEAEKQYARALELDPKNAEIWINLGVTRYYGSRFPEARQAFKEASALAPDNATPIYNLAMLELQTGRPDVARTLFRRALQIEPEHPGAREELRRLEQASTANTRG